MVCEEFLSTKNSHVPVYDDLALLKRLNDGTRTKMYLALMPFIHMWLVYMNFLYTQILGLKVASRL